MSEKTTNELMLEAEVDSLRRLCRDANKLFTEIMPQAGKLVFQDYGLLNETLLGLAAVNPPEGES